MNDKEIYEKAAEKWGNSSQLLIVIEELNELAVEISHYIRGRRDIGDIYLIEEIADVEIVLDQLKLIIKKENPDLEKDLNIIKENKLKRLEERVSK